MWLRCEMSLIAGHAFAVFNYPIADRRMLKDLEDKIVTAEISPDDVTDAVAIEDEEIIDSTTPEKEDFKGKQKVFSGCMCMCLSNTHFHPVQLYVNCYSLS